MEQLRSHKSCLHFRSKFFPVRVDVLLKRFDSTVEQLRSHKSCVLRKRAISRTAYPKSLIQSLTFGCCLSNFILLCPVASLCTVVHLPVICMQILSTPTHRQKNPVFLRKRLAACYQPGSQLLNSLTTKKQKTKFSSANLQKMLSPNYIVLRIQRLEDKQCRSR